jgi:hypothetical protein
MIQRLVLILAFPGLGAYRAAARVGNRSLNLDLGPGPGTCIQVQTTEASA